MTFTPLSLGFTLQIHSVTINTLYITFELMFQNRTPTFLILPEHLPGPSNKLIMQRPVLLLFGLGEPVPALFLVHEILKAVLDPLPQIEYALGAFLTVDRLAVLPAEQPALLAV